MNKRISTLLAAGLLIAGSPLYDVAAKVVEPTDFLKAIVSDSLDVAKLDLGSDLKIELNGDVDITKAVTKAGEAPTTSGHLFITRPDLTITEASGKQVKFTGRLAIKADGVTVKGLEFIHDVAVNNGSYWKNAITVEAKLATIEGNIINCSSSTNKLANGIVIFPTAEDAEFTVKNNTIKNANVYQDGASSSALIVAENCPTPSNSNQYSAVLKDFNVASINNNTFEGNTSDYVYYDYNKTGANFVYKEVQITPFVENGEILNASEVVGFVNHSDKGKGIFFNGTAEQLAEALEGQQSVENFPIDTKDGVVVSGVAQLQPTIETGAGKYELVKRPNASEYYLLVRYSEWESGKGSFIVTVDKDGKPGQIEEANLTVEQAAADNNLWKMEQYLDKDGDYTFIFTNKAGQKLTVNNEAFFHSVGNAPYNNGVVFEMDGKELDQSANKYYGLYKAGIHTMTAGELNFIENDGFSITIKPEGLVGNPFSGKLAPMTWNATDKKFDETYQNSDATVYYLKNEDGDYIVAKLFGAEGGNKDDAYYVFATASEEDLIADLKATKTENRKLFGEFRTFYKPVGANDDMEKIERIDSMEVKVLAQDKTLKFAPVGYANISTTDKTEKTLTASLESAQYPISFTMGNNVVDPKTIVKGQFVKITKITEDGNVILAAANCSGEGAWVEAVGNDLEAQWAITYDTDKNEYKLVNRENLDVTVTAIKKNWLREDANDKDNLYLFDGDVVKIELLKDEDVKEYDGYKWLGEVDSKLFKIAHWSGVHGAQAWVTTNDKGYALVNIDESKAINIAANAKVDTVFVESTLGYFKDDDYKTKKNTLKVPVYVFQSVGGENKLTLEDDKLSFNKVDYPISLAIRKDAGHFNLRQAFIDNNDKYRFNCGKAYASLSPNDDASYLKMMYNLYADNTNDLFDVVDNDAPLYRRFNSLKLEGNEGDKADTLRFYEKYRNEYLQVENNKNFMVEGIDFLGIYTPDFTKDGKSFVVDTAWVGRSKGEKKPQYLISIDRNDNGNDQSIMCPICKEIVENGGERPANCPHDKEYANSFHFGNYLVNFADSVKNAVNKKDYAWKGYTRAGFVKAAHQGDSLYILTGQFADWTVADFDSAKIHKAVADKKYDKKYIVNLTGDNHKLVTWSMRFVDPANAANELEEDRSFLMESVAAEGQPAIAPSKASWLKMQNGCLVLSGTLDGSESSFDQITDDDDALIFNVEKGNKDDLATDNEEIATSEVTVIAGAGQVTIANAAGKKVVISNILGQTVANTVITSDNATIAAPQGVVVVAVEGEEAVKAIVK